MARVIYCHRAFNAASVMRALRLPASPVYAKAIDALFDEAARESEGETLAERGSEARDVYDLIGGAWDELRLYARGFRFSSGAMPHPHAAEHLVMQVKRSAGDFSVLTREERAVCDALDEKLRLENCDVEALPGSQYDAAFFELLRLRASLEFLTQIDSALLADKMMTAVANRRYRRLTGNKWPKCSLLVNATMLARRLEQRLGAGARPSARMR